MNQDQRRRAEIERALDHVAGVDHGLVEAALGEQIVEHQPVLAVKIEHPHPLVIEVRHVDRQIVEQ